MPAKPPKDQHEVTAMIYFVLFKSPVNQQWYFRIRSANHHTIASSEGYHNKQDAVNTIQVIRVGAASAGVYDESTQQWAA
jgi:uncharacterized protein